MYLEAAKVKAEAMVTNNNNDVMEVSACVVMGWCRVVESLIFGVKSGEDRRSA